MRLVAVAIVRNECDIIEAFVRHNASVLDRLHIVDNASSDVTAEILRRLAASGLPLTLAHDEGIANYQGSKTTALIKAALEDEPWDCLFPLYADEFLVAPDCAALEAEIAALAPGEAGLLIPDQFAPLGSDEAGDLDPVRRIVHRTAGLPAQSEPQTRQGFGRMEAAKLSAKCLKSGFAPQACMVEVWAHQLAGFLSPLIAEHSELSLNFAQ